MDGVCEWFTPHPFFRKKKDIIKMACTNFTLKGIARGCKDSCGGIVKVWVNADYDTAKGSVALVEPDGTQAKVTTPDVKGWKVFNFFKNTGSMTSTLNVSETAGSSFTTEVSLTFMKQDSAKRLEMLGLLLGQCMVIVKDANGKYWVLGMDAPVEASAGTAVTGTAATDLNGYTVTLKDDSKLLPLEVVQGTEDLEGIVVA